MAIRCVWNHVYIAMKRLSTAKPSLYLAAIKSFVTGLVARMLALFDRKVPVGYEDETGFHKKA